MPQQIGSGVTLRGLWSEDFSYTWLLSGSMTAADVGKAMTIDTTANNTAKLAGSGDVIIGRLNSYENRIQEGIVVGAIQHKGNLVFGYTGTVPARGVSVVGSATPGKVVAAAALGITNMVVEQDTVALEIVVMLG